MSQSHSSPSWRLRQLLPVLKQCALQPDDQTTQTDNIQVIPKVSLIDQRVQIRVHGLPTKAKVTLHVKTQQEWRRKPAVFRSCGHFVTSDQGDLDLHRDACVGGMYTGLDPMGPFWSMKPCPSGPQNVRMVVRNGKDPVLYTLSIYQGHWSLSDLVAKETTLTPLSSTTVTRLKKAGDVRRIPVKEGGVRGVLFLPPGDGPHPGVIDMFGGAGGLMETRAALLASHGFAALALPFFAYEDLPTYLKDITFDYFEEAAEWLNCHRAVKDGGIGVVGVSTGGSLALIMAWLCPQVKAVVSINSPGMSYEDDVIRKGGTTLLKGVKVQQNKVRRTADGVEVRYAFPYTIDQLIPVWESSTHILMLVSDDDGQIDPRTANVIHGLYPEEKRHLLEVVHYPGAGHLLEPPYSPHCRTCYNPVCAYDMMWGGNPIDHAPAQEDSWRRILAFLHTHLS